MYIGRFAPSPTGPLHFGSLVAALAGWLDARAAGGKWLVRIEDLDGPRVVPGAAEQILETLALLGLHWDGEPVFQSRRLSLYENALSKIRDKTYWCGCSRSEIADSSVGVAADGARIYPGTCRDGMKPGATRRALRFRAPAETVRFDDRVQGEHEEDVAHEVGDFVLQRADGTIAYQLAVVVDDAAQGVTDVVRGADLLGSTARQIVLQRALALPRPRYLHVPAAVNAAGEKLSKQTGAPAAGISMLEHALAFLGQSKASSLEDAARAWDPARIPRRRAIIAT
ncbi:MAG: tRNA glutamyl-Q(34) synthetase GluQRS [Clostridia bacterium]